MTRRSLPLLIIHCVAAALFVGTASAQDDGPPRRIRESVSLETSSATAKRLDAVRQLLADRQWAQAVDTLLQVAATDGDALVPLEPGRYVNVQMYANSLLAALPPEGLALYRTRIEAQVGRWLKDSETAIDDAALKKIVRQAFASSYGDDALWQLGERAWERGETGAARGYWLRMLPLPNDADVGDPKLQLQYPDTDFDLAEIQARLVLCSVAAGDLERAGGELRAFGQIFPDAEGRLAGRNGKLADLLAEELERSRHWPAAAARLNTSTFARNAQRNAVAPRPVDAGGIQWRAPLPANELRLPLRRPALPDPGPLCYYPVVYENMVLLTDGRQILAWNVRTGEPAWPRADGVSPVIYPTAADLPMPAPERPVGVPRFTMSVHEGRLYARFGSPVTARARNELRDLPNEIVCLNLARGEGRLEWKMTPGDLIPGESGWMFEGSPVLHGGRGYVALRRGHPQMQLNVLCFDAVTGRPVWNRKVCTAVADLNDSHSLLSHQLLTLGNGAVYYSTDAGAIAALDAAEGTLRWVVTYESRPSENHALLSDHTEQGLTPCLFHDGLVVAAPNDADALMALDAATGVLRWKQTLPGGVRHLLGAAGRTLVVSGDRLWGLDLATGRLAGDKNRRPRWPVGNSDPLGHGYGRGLIAGDLIYWPRREDILIVGLDGRVRRTIPLVPLGTRGGNLTIAADRLLIARPHRLDVLWEYGQVVKHPRRETSQNPEDDRPQLN